MRAFLATLIACLCALGSHAEARGVHHVRHHWHHRIAHARPSPGQDFGILGVMLGQGKAAATQTATTAYSAVGVGTSIAAHATVSAAYGAYRVFSDPRPREWCGWQMRQWLHVADRSYNVARKWADYGVASIARVGVIVVWPHHVGRIVGKKHGEWVVQSGNDGHAVRTRPRSLAGAIAIRWP